MKYIVGVDEVGRGPLAGPVTVGIVLIFSEKNVFPRKLKDYFRGAKDSKKMTPKSREIIAKKIKIKAKENLLRYIVVNQSNKVIDKRGINRAIYLCIEKGLMRLGVRPKESEIFLDGGLKASKEFIYQKTIIKGDDKKLVISLASIIAKVTRDNLMKKFHKKYPKYGFSVHKGYGTERHRKMIKDFGLSPIHRKSFCHLT